MSEVTETVVEETVDAIANSSKLLTVVSLTIISVATVNQFRKMRDRRHARRNNKVIDTTCTETTK